MTLENAIYMNENDLSFLFHSGICFFERGRLPGIKYAAALSFYIGDS